MAFDRMVRGVLHLAVGIVLSLFLTAPGLTRAQTSVWPPFTGTVTVGVPSVVNMVVPLQVTTTQLNVLPAATVLFTVDAGTAALIVSLNPGLLGYWSDGVVTRGEFTTAHPNAKLTVSGITATLTGDARFTLNVSGCAAPVGALTCNATASYSGAIPAGVSNMKLLAHGVNYTISDTGLGGLFEAQLNIMINAAAPTFDQFLVFDLQITVNKGAQVVAFGAAPASILVGTTGTVSATGSPTGNAITFSSNTPAICTVSGTTVTGVAAGSCTIAATQAGDSNYNPATQTQTFAIGKGNQTITFGTAPSVLYVGGTATVSATGGPSGVAVVFTSTTPTICSVSGTTVTGIAAGTCTIAANQAGNVNYNPAPQVTQSFAVTAATNLPRLANISTRMQVLTGNDVMIGGFVIGGSANKTVVVRARGPSLIPFGINNALANPVLQLVRSSDQVVIAANDDWQQATNQADVAASGFAPSNALESAILVNLPPGAYTAIVTGLGNTTGVGIVEVFEVDAPLIPLANISTRGQVLTGNDVMIGGFVISGSGPQTVVVRARGPSLIPFGITNALANPVLQLVRSSDQVVIATNDDWQSASNAADVTASGFAPSNALESAILITLQPGAYTAIVTGVGNTTGVGIVEVFAVP